MPQIQLNNLTTGQYLLTLLLFHLIQHKVLTEVTYLGFLRRHTRADQSYCTSVQCSICSRAADSLHLCYCQSKQEQQLDVFQPPQPPMCLQVHMLSQHPSQSASSPCCSATSSPARLIRARYVHSTTLNYEFFGFTFSLGSV